LYIIGNPENFEKVMQAKRHYRANIFTKFHFTFIWRFIKKDLK